jgi:hypothetical protein
MENNNAICTIVAKNYLSFARVLTNSFLEHNPTGKVFVLLVDKLDGYFNPESEKFELVTVDKLWDEDVQQILFRSTDALEACTSLKPYFLQHLFNNYHFSKLAYFDPDILITESLADLWQLLKSYSIVLTPHLTEPIAVNDYCKPGEIDVLRAGIYNLGFIALANVDSVKAFLKWWWERLKIHCSRSHPILFVDQKWIDLVPGYFKDVHILHDSTYNVAYWNLQSRTVKIEQGRITVNGQPLHFFHFSGFDPDNIDEISKYQDRFTLKQMRHLKPLFQKYKDLLVANGYLETKKWPYAFDYFDNNVKIPHEARITYLSLGDKAKEFGDPFRTQGPNSFFRWLKHKRPIRRLVKASVKRAFRHSSRLLDGLSLISQGIEVLLGISPSPGHHSPTTPANTQVEQRR